MKPYIFNVYILRISAMLIILASLSSCSGSFNIRPTGNMGQAIDFTFYESISSDSALEQNVVQFAVQQKANDSGWITIWQLSGKQTASSITYGKKYDGLSEKVSAKPFDLKARFRVVASSQPAFGPILYSEAYFTFSESGQIELTPEIQSDWRN